MNINDNEKESYLVKQLYDYWREKKLNDFFIYCSDVFPSLSEKEVHIALNNLSEKSFSISYHDVYGMGYDEHGNEEEQDLIFGKLHIILTDKFESFANKILNLQDKPVISYDFQNNILVVNDNYKISYDVNDINTQVLRIIFKPRNKLKKWSLDEIIEKMQGREPDLIEKKTRKNFNSTFHGINEKVSVNTDGKVPKLLIPSTYGCQLNPSYTYLNR